MIKAKIIKDIRTLFEPKKKKDYHKSVSISFAFCNNYVEYKSNDEENKTISKNLTYGKFN